MTLVQTVDGVRISYRASGEGSLTLLFMHLDLTGLLAIAMDLRGHGDSEDPIQATPTSNLQGCVRGGR
jgi:pimeloyl-ACP methyl ester carboxylesterase